MEVKEPTRNELLSKNVALIRSIAEGKDVYLSTSQACMCALALGRQDLLKSEKKTWPEAWRRIDMIQFESIVHFHNAYNLITLLDL